MKAIASLAALILAVACEPSRAQTAPSRDYPVKPVPFTAVHVTDGFWAPRIEINRTVTIPFAFRKDEETGRVASSFAPPRRSAASRSKITTRRAIRSTIPMSTK